VVSADAAVVTIKYDHVLPREEITELERLGLSFFYIDGQVARTRSIYPVRVPWSLIDKLGGRQEVLRMESAWRPCVYTPLDVSVPEIEADLTWVYHDPFGLPLTGKGMRIADFDTGIDVFHPSFFFADGDTLDWIDVDVNGQFTPGTDAVDLNKNSLPDTDETLRFTDGWVSDYAGVFSPATPSNDDGVYQTYWDWLYADKNGNAARDFGTAAGFTESDPTYGEPFFIALDDNDDGVLDVGEKLVALGTSKVVVSLNAGMVERTRGVDLIYSDIDTYGHGTPVSGAMVGGTVGRHRFNGVAPDAELIVGSFSSQAPVSYFIPWARSHGANVMLHEYSAFIFEFLDGSSLDEELITAEHADIAQVVPSGNLGIGDKHAVATVAGQDSVYPGIQVAYTDLFYCTVIWHPQPAVDLTFRLRTPLGSEVTLVDSVTYADNFYIWSSYDVSPRGTYKMDILAEKGTNANVYGRWGLRVVNGSAQDVVILSNVADNVSSWGGGTEFLSYKSKNRNVTFPATADSAIANGSYSTRGFESLSGVGSGTISPGEISVFSGRGTRVDGYSLIDLCAPGNYDIFSPRSHADYLGYPVGSYQQFSGTSAAGPHVAAAAAIVQQAHPEMAPWEVEQMLTSGALEDGFTGTVYNDTWGYGKLRILGALQTATGVADMADGKRTPALHLGTNYPNPFNPTTWIPFYLPQSGMTSVTVYSIRGEVVTILRDRWYREGPHSIRWDGRDRAGNPVASGIYFCVLRQGGIKQTRKMALIR
jgi:subtilisin family serine protease